jgi:hypothetical protein
MVDALVSPSIVKMDKQPARTGSIKTPDFLRPIDDDKNGWSKRIIFYLDRSKSRRPEDLLTELQNLTHSQTVRLIAELEKMGTTKVGFKLIDKIRRETPLALRPQLPSSNGHSEDKLAGLKVA